MKKIKHILNVIIRNIYKYSACLAKSYWYASPFTSAPLANKDKYLSLWEEAKGKKYSKVDALEEKYGFALDKFFLDTLALHTQISIKDSTLCYEHGRILYSVLSDYLKKTSSKNISIFETGTAKGFSSTIMAKALMDQETYGKIYTFDVLPHEHRIYWNAVDDQEGKKSRKELLKPWSEIISEHVIFVEGDSKINIQNFVLDRINFAFLDGAHKKKDVLFEFSAIAKRQIKGDIIVFDDYNKADFAGLVKAVDEGCDTLNYNKDVVEIGAERRYVIATKK